jgi:predicted permease
VPEGDRLPKGTESVSLMGNRVDENYFETAGIALVRGRGFLKTDTENSPRVAVINEALAAHYWPGQDAIGKRFRLEGWVEIVGISKNTKYLSTLEPPTDFVYVPYRQNPRGHMTLMVESAGDPAALTAPLREVVRGLDSNLPVYDVRTMEEFYDARAVRAYQIIVQAVASMGLMGMALALAGLYGLMAYAVSSRTREIGIRMAIGAGRGEVLRMVLRQGLVLALSGMAVGLLLSAGAARLLRSAFPGNSPLPVYLLVAPMVLAVTMLAAYFPARRASRVDPMTALRDE